MELVPLGMRRHRHRLASNNEFVEVSDAFAVHDREGSHPEVPFAALP